MNFDAFIHDIIQNRWKVHGVEIYENGQLIHEWGNTRESRFSIYSATKTVTSLAVGMAMDEGKIDIEKSILEYLPKEFVDKMASEQKETYKKISVKRLLTMSVPDIPFQVEGNSWLQFALSQPIGDVERRVFNYSNVSAYLVGVAVANALGESLYDYLNRKLFIPLDIIEPTYERCPDGYFYGASKMELSVHELSKIGLLFYNRGEYKGKRVVSEEYVKQATAIQQMNCEGGYGFFIWKYGDGYSVNGKWKQRCFVFPERKLIVTFLSDIPDEKCTLIECMEKYILR